MGGNMNKRPVGRCSQCNGIVSVPTVWHGVNRPVPTCERCGAVADEYAHLPIIPTRPVVPCNKWENDSSVEPWRRKNRPRLEVWVLQKDR